MEFNPFRTFRIGVVSSDIYMNALCIRRRVRGTITSFRTFCCMISLLFTKYILCRSMGWSEFDRRWLDVCELHRISWHFFFFGMFFFCMIWKIGKEPLSSNAQKRALIENRSYRSWPKKSAENAMVCLQKGMVLIKWNTRRVNSLVCVLFMSTKEQWYGFRSLFVNFKSKNQNFSLARMFSDKEHFIPNNGNHSNKNECK